LWQVFLNEDDMPQLRLGPTYRGLLRATCRPRRSKICEERFTAAIQLLKNISSASNDSRVCQSIIAPQGDF